MGQVYVYRILSVVNTIRIDHQDFSFTAEDDDEGEVNCEEVMAYCVCVWCVCVCVLISITYTRGKYLAVLTCSMNNVFLSN